MFMDKKAQMEMLGIAVVIIIILIGAMFFFVLMAPGSERSVVVSVARTEIGANTINTLLKTTTNCKKLTISELIADCVDGAAVSCGIDDSCGYVKSVISRILDQTLTAWGMDFQFDVLKQEGNDFSSVGINLGTGMCVTKDHFEQIIPTQLGLAKASLDLC